MNNLEKKMVNTLIDLKENHHFLSVKCEFDAEGTSFEEAMRLKELTLKAGLDFSIKIGGCEAIKDMLDTQKININSLIAPMIESPYAMKKFVNAIESVFTDKEKQNISFLINIETITGYNNLKDIVSAKDFDNISGIVLGRTDMVGSMNLSKQEINSEKIFVIADSISNKMKELKKDFIIGGSVSTDSIPFFRQLPYLTKFETRKIIFDAQKALNDKNINNGLFKAIDFEMMWLKYKQDSYNNILTEDNKRFVMLEKLSTKILEEISCANK